MNIVEVRCPVGHRRLFTKLRLGQETAVMVQPDNLIEFSCADCSTRTTRVFHRFDFAGELISSFSVSREPPSP